MDFPYLHLRFDLVARTPLKLGGYQAGERLRDALAGVMLQAVCPENPRREKPTPGHAALCPVCWLLAADTDPHAMRRAYAVVPPLPAPDLLQAGERFSFVITLFGEGLRYLPYFVLAVPEMGRQGVGPGRGKFDLQAVWALQPLLDWAFPLLQPGEHVVRVPDDFPTADIFALAAGLPPVSELQVHFLTPTRLVDEKRLVRAPDFAVFFRRMLSRIDDLARLHNRAGRRPPEDVERLHRLADGVRLVDVDTTWVDLFAPSGRTGRRTPMGGFVGRAVYRLPDGGELLPWLLLGQAAQAGKLAAKGSGVFELALPGRPGYWQRCFSPLQTEPEALETE